MQILAIDVGTSSMRGILFDEKGKPLRSHRVRYRVTTIDQTRVEQDPQSWIRAAEEICRLAALWGSVDALALTSQRSSVMALDGDGRALAPAIMWQDTRNSELVAELSAHEDTIFAEAGARPNTVYAGPKMAWLRQNRPQLYASAAKLCTIADLLTKRITGRFVTDTTYGSRSLLMNLRTGQWDQELLGLMGLDEEKLCPLVAPGSITGQVSAAFATATGLREGIPLVSAGGDQQCGALGQGVVGSGRIAATFGTGAFLLEQVNEVPPEMPRALICGAHALPGAYTLESSMLTCAALYDWCRTPLFPQMLADASGRMVLRERGKVESTARGAWMTAAVTLGLVKDYEEAFELAASDSSYDPYEPNEQLLERYQEMGARMNELYANTI